MEEDIRKRGMLYLQQQRFGKKWKKVWTILYRESTCSISRLEFFECKDGMSTLEKPNRKQDNKKVIKLSDCIRVSEVDIEGCPRDCGPFLVETTEKLFIFAADNAELEDWTQRLCEIAFPMKRGDRGAGPRRGSLPRVLGDADGVSMENNSLYGERERGMKDFKVCARRSETADKCGLKGYYLMRTDFESLLLKDPRTGEVLYTWPYRFLRRFGRDKMTFSFEAGRRCQSGEGNFEFETKQGNEIFQAVEAAINLQRPTMPRRQTSGGVQEKETPAPPPAVPAEDRRIYSTVDERQVGQAGQSRTGRSPPDGQPCRLDAPTADKVLTGVKSLNIDQRPMPRKSQVKNFRSCPLAKSEDQTYSQITLGSMDHGMERSRSPGSLSADADADYSLPFDAIGKNVMADILQGSRHGGLPAPGDQQQAGEREAAERQRDDRNDDDDGLDPLYDSIDEMAIGAAALRIRTDSPKTYTRAEHIYDEPEGVALGPADRAGSGRLTQGSGSPSSGGSSATSLYDDPEEVKGQAWRIMGEAGDPSGHEYPYNPNADDYAVPKPPRRAFKPPLDRELEENRDNGLSPYDNVNVKKKN